MARPVVAWLDPKFAHSEHLRMDPPCCFECDEGGTVIFCDGPCSCHFHYFIEGQSPNEPDGHGPSCTQLPISKGHDRAAKWLCDLCEQNQGRCFACGLLGRTLKPTTSEPLVVQCAHPDCYSFYHVGCLRTLLRVGELPLTADAGLGENPDAHPDALICPRHYCEDCKDYGEGIWDFVQCRRCPRAWCRDDGVGANKHVKRGVKGRECWDIGDWHMIYCTRHVIPEGSDQPTHEWKQNLITTH